MARSTWNSFVGDHFDMLIQISLLLVDIRIVNRLESVSSMVSFMLSESVFPKLQKVSTMTFFFTPRGA